jgi:hypothetical protein
MVWRIEVAPAAKKELDKKVPIGGKAWITVV